MKSLFFMVVMLCVVSGCTNNNNEKINRCIEGATFVEQMAELRDSGLTRDELFRRYSSNDLLNPEALPQVSLLIEYVYGNRFMSPERLRFDAFSGCMVHNN